ncbi:hypothetical protein SAMN04488511_11421 [Pedobacter suwonensis]|uniref:Uncharacterized protein n=1 Tax=Pedobacter suwonensis TaxID=332999 RepID=A0A1I0TT11_9SPHI|nr:hypothetical protein SAMN04488511_11421 [Pedobacter suwonensis]
MKANNLKQTNQKIEQFYNFLNSGSNLVIQFESAPKINEAIMREDVVTNSICLI